MAVIEWCKTDGDDKASAPYAIPGRTRIMGTNTS